MMFGQMTAGSWIYIGSQGIVQGTYETFAEAGRQHYGGELADKWILTAGLGGMGGAQPLAATMAGASMLAIECQQSRIDMRLARVISIGRRRTSTTRSRSCAMPARARRRCRSAFSATRPRSFPSSSRRNVRPDMVTDQTSAHDLVYGYLPAGWSVEQWKAAQADARQHATLVAGGEAVDRRAREGDARVPRAGHPDVRLRQQHPPGRVRRRRGRRVRVPGLRAGVHPPAVLRRQGAVPLGRAVRRSGGHLQDRSQGQGAVPRRTRICIAGSTWRASASRSRGLPARICWLGLGERHLAGLAFNEMVETRRAQGADRHRPRSPRHRQRRVAQPRDRIDGATAPTPCPTGRC